MRLLPLLLGTSFVAGSASSQPTVTLDEATARCIALVLMEGHEQEQEYELVERCVWQAQLRKACDAGEMKACLNLGTSLRDRGNPAEASKWYRHAAAQSAKMNLNN